jgi:hypothetical protein
VPRGSSVTPVRSGLHGLRRFALSLRRYMLHNRVLRLPSTFAHRLTRQPRTLHCCQNARSCMSQALPFP